MTGGERFIDREDAGRTLVEALAGYAGRDDVIVLGLPRGGVPVAAVVAGALRAPLDVLVVRKLGAFGQAELAIGAIAPGVRFVDEALRTRSGTSRDALAHVEAAERAELSRRERVYRGTRSPPRLEGRTVLVVDDGIATGATMIAAARSVRASHPARVVLVAPVASPETVARLQLEADAVIVPVQSERCVAVGQWYRDFPQVSDAEVVASLASPARSPEVAQPPQVSKHL